ncbi:cell death regulator Aven-like isoform X1 [Paramormyrops kingsleyae]|uniref:cell death regulator Aven-like isoform X1 n=1 Tax=Paramormyrops kingsleyae TaxID=1676925 RepID=UPI003B97B6A4
MRMYRIQRLCSRSFYSTSTVMDFRPRLQILPSRKSLFDEPLQIKVDGLIPEQRVELKAKLIDDRGVLFKSSAEYSADFSGTVDLGTSGSLGGSYTGIEPMGLFWSMTPEKPCSRLMIKDASRSLLVNIEVINATDLGHALASETVERGFMVEGTRRSPVKVGRIRGTLFVPPGPGPFPGVLDLYTFGGGLTEVRGSLLANKGFVVLCLAYYNYADLPKSVSHFDLEYFEEALTFLRSQPEKIQDDANNLEDVEDEAAAVFSKRKLESNWSRYEAAEESERSEEQPTQRGADYHALLASAGDSYTQFQFAEEKDWELDSLANNQMSILFMDVQAVAQSLQLLPLCHKLNLEPELVQVTMPSELPIMPLKVRQEACMTEQLKAAGTAHRGFARGLASPTVAVPGSHKIQGLPPNGTSAPASEPEVADEELDFLLSLQHPATNMKNSEADSKQTADVPERPPVGDTLVEPEPVKKPDQTEEDLEDWLDSMIS